MIYLGILVGIGIMSAMIYMVLDKKSSSSTRIACLVALGVMVLTVIICLFIVFTDNRVPVDPSVLIVGAPVETKKDGDSNIMLLFLLVIVLLILFSFVAYVALKDNKGRKDTDSGSEKFSF